MASYPQRAHNLKQASYYNTSRQPLQKILLGKEGPDTMSLINERGAPTWKKCFLCSLQEVTLCMYVLQWFQAHWTKTLDMVCCGGLILSCNSWEMHYICFAHVELSASCGTNFLLMWNFLLTWNWLRFILNIVLKSSRDINTVVVDDDYIIKQLKTKLRHEESHVDFRKN